MIWRKKKESWDLFWKILDSRCYWHVIPSSSSGRLAFFQVSFRKKNAAALENVLHSVQFDWFDLTLLKVVIDHVNFLKKSHCLYVQILIKSVCKKNAAAATKNFKMCCTVYNLIFIWLYWLLSFSSHFGNLVFGCFWQKRMPLKTLECAAQCTIWLIWFDFIGFSSIWLFWFDY